MIDKLIESYVSESLQTKVKLQAKLFAIFTETTGYRPEDLCLVEQQIVKGTEFKTIYYFDLKHRYKYGRQGLEGKE